MLASAFYRFFSSFVAFLCKAGLMGSIVSPLQIQNEDSASIDSAIISMEHPSPVSVLEAAFYQDELPLSPAMNILSATEG